MTAAVEVDALAELARSGLDLYHRGALQDAQVRFELLGLMQPEFYLPYQYLGLLAARRGELDQAVRHLETAIALLESFSGRSIEQDETLQHLYFLVGELLARDGRPQCAGQAFSQLRALGPKLAPALRAPVAARSEGRCAAHGSQ